MIKKLYYKLISNIVVCVSVLFVIIYLYRNHLFTPLKIFNYFCILNSIVILIIGFLLDAIIIKMFLKLNDIKLTLKEAITLTGKFTLAKYIPGKIGVIIGKAAFIHEKSSISKFRSIEIVFIYQLLFLLSAVVLSILTLFNFLNDRSEKLIYILISIIIFVYILSFKKSQKVVRFILMKIFKMSFNEIYSQKSILIALSGTTFCWLLWVLGFWLLGMSVGVKISIRGAMLFPLATIVGVIAIIAPGGIGIKEGVISAGLISFGIEKTDSISLSVYSRLWFLLGEVVLFLIAIIISGIYNTKPK